jgi:thioredoxin 1
MDPGDDVINSGVSLPPHISTPSHLISSNKVHPQQKERSIPSHILNPNSQAHLAAMTSTPEIPTLHSKAEYLKAVMYEGVTILEGTATWCRNCHIIAPEVAKMVAEYPNVKFYTYDVEECEDIAQELGVRSMPTFSVFKDGDIMEGVTGARPKEIRKAIEGCL